MSNTILWKHDPSVAITSFTLQKSTDKGIIFSALATVAFSVTGPNWDAANRRWQYVDTAGNPGDVYSITATGTNGTSPAALAISPPVVPTTCTIIGYLTDAAGNVDVQVPISVQTTGSRGEQWISSPPGALARNPEALAVIGANLTVFPDNNGMWQVKLLRRSFARVSIPAVQLDWAFEVPNTPGPLNIRDIPQLRGAELTVFPEMTGTPLALPFG